MMWLLFLLVVDTWSSAEPKKKVCIIGAGVSGLTSVKLVSENLDSYEPIVFERGTDIGGQWKYTNNTVADEHCLPVLSGVYKNLRTDGPKVLMALRDYPEFHGENRSYVKHETVLEYLRNYTEKFNLRRYIKLDTVVENVSLIHGERWHVEARNLNSEEKEFFTCDAVMICNGHFTKPYLPVIPGLDTFTGRTLHSHSYRKPEEFINKTVAVLGASYSGLDIGIEISSYAKKVYLSHRKAKITSKLPDNMIQVLGVVAANGSDLILSDGSKIQADAFIFCTGYEYDFPFLDESSGITVTKGKYVHPLYKNLINIYHPTMAFVGLPFPGFPFVVPYYQAHYFISLLWNKVTLPSHEIMLKESELPSTTPISKAHHMNTSVFTYLYDLAKAVGIAPLSKPLMKAAAIWVEDRKDLLHFKDHEIIVDKDGSVKLIKPKKMSRKVYCKLNF